MDMDCFPRAKFFVYISTMFANNAGRSSFVHRPEGVCVIRLCFFHAFINHWFQAVYPFTKFNGASVVNPGVNIIGPGQMFNVSLGTILDLRSNRLRINFFMV